LSLSNIDNTPIAQLGPFDLHSYLGGGAMGQVWRARHRKQNVGAAIKVMTDQRAQFEGYQRQFRHEVRAAAGLSHPGIVMVFDYGSVTAEVQEATLGELGAGQPFLAMELCPRGSLHDLNTELSFADVRSILLSLLDALAHAHARGVIHRDLKPANILLGDDTDWTGVKLTDFGLAFIQERLTGDDMPLRGACGTPAYMPPEQLLGEWRDIGPWSDLYSLGCIAYQLVCGRAPYMSTSIVGMAKKHLQMPIPALTPQMDVPDEFEAWIRGLLQKETHVRCRHAADAAWELLLMDAPDEGRSHRPGPNISGPNVSGPNLFGPGWATFSFKHFDNLLDSTTLDERLLESQPPVEPNSTDPSATSRPADRVSGHRGAPAQAPLPSTWHNLIDRRPSTHLLGAGLGLYGLRHIPLIGREAERDVMWQQLHDVVQETTPRAILLRGAAGTGKSYLADWLSERAQETGAAICLQATHSTGPDGGDGLVRMLSRFFRTAGMQRADIVERLRDWFVTRNDLDPYAWDALTEFIEPATDDDVADGQRKIHFESPAQRYNLVIRVLRLISQERVVIVSLDDLQWASDSLGFLSYVLDSEACAELPVLFVGTLREDALVDQSAARSKLAQFALDPKVEHLSLEPLSTQTQAELIEKLLLLAPELARRVADRTCGNPLFAVQLIGDWVDRGVLEVADAGFVLADGEEAIIPDDLFDVWSSRLQEALGDATAPQIHALELAATLGNEVDETEWRACLELMGCDFPSSVVQKLLSHRLLEATDTGVRFVHSMLRESLERRATEAGRHVEHHQICSRMLDQRYESEPYLAERLGRHRLAARAYGDALAPLLEGARVRGNAAEFDPALVLLDLHLDAIDALELPETCVPRVDNAMLRAFALAVRGEFEVSDIFAQKAVATAEKLGDPCLHAYCLARRVQCLSYRNNFQSPTELLDRAQRLATEASCGDDILMLIGQTYGCALRDEGRIPEAIERFQTARQLAINRGDLLKQVTMSRELGSCERRRGNLAKAETMLRKALSVCERIGLQMRIGDTLLSLADVVRLRGRLEEAERLYRKTQRHNRDIRPMVATVAKLNLALMYAQNERFEETRSLLEKLRPELESTGPTKFLFYLNAISLPCLAFEHSWATLESQFNEVAQTMERHDIVDDDAAICLQQAGKVAAAASHFQFARRAFDAALTQWEQLGDDDKVRATRRELDRIVALSE
jgi:serine/threonine protein kinase/tetratricopeptide (TPR) repeat protein